MISEEIKNTIKVSVALLFLLIFLYVINPPAQSALAIYILFTIIAITIYSLKQFQPHLIGISSKNLGISIILALFLGGLYYFATKLIPSFSLGLPILPQAISDQLKFFIIVFVAPVVETIIFQGALLGYIRSFSPTTRQTAIAIFIQAIVFSLFHLAAYISGFYALPTITEGLTAFSANMSAFLAAFIFALISGILVVGRGIRNLVFVAIFHLALNLIIYTSLSVVFT